jgi:hypothetical protein
VRHITTGRYLCLDEEKGLMVVDPEKANAKMSAFCFRISKVRVVTNGSVKIKRATDYMHFPHVVHFIEGNSISIIPPYPALLTLC